MAFMASANKFQWSESPASASMAARLLARSCSSCLCSEVKLSVARSINFGSLAAGFAWLTKGYQPRVKIGLRPPLALLLEMLLNAVNSTEGLEVGAATETGWLPRTKYLGRTYGLPNINLSQCSISDKSIVAL